MRSSVRTETRTVARKLERTGTLASPKYQRHISEETGNDQFSEIHPFETIISISNQNLINRLICQHISKKKQKKKQ